MFAREDVPGSVGLTAQLFGAAPTDQKPNLPPGHFAGAPWNRRLALLQKGSADAFPLFICDLR